MDLRAKTCCFTGHRSLSGAEKLKAAVRLRRVIEEQIKAGIVFYGAGGALGFDTLAAQTVLDMVSAQQPPVYKTCRPATTGLHVSRDRYSHKHPNSSQRIPVGHRVPKA